MIPYLFFKRLFDIIFSLLMLFFALVPMLFIAFFIAVIDKQYFLFPQERIGYKNTSFILYKFRTMRPLPIASTTSVHHISRVTVLGKFLRATSLDELPSLFNVLFGHLSFVGPRPLLPEYLPLYSPFQIRRHEVKPGITGLAQVSGRNSTTWSKRFSYDVFYVNHLSFSLDFSILLKTFVVVFLRLGVNSSDSLTMPPFTGHTDL